MVQAEVVVLEEFRSRRRSVADEAWVSKRSVAEHFGVSTKTIERWMKRGLPYDKPYADRGLVRFKLSRCEAWFCGSAA